jgi:hypothetical protein
MREVPLQARGRSSEIIDTGKLEVLFNEANEEKYLQKANKYVYIIQSRKLNGLSVASI